MVVREAWSESLRVNGSVSEEGLVLAAHRILLPYSAPRSQSWSKAAGNPSSLFRAVHRKSSFLAIHVAISRLPPTTITSLSDSAAGFWSGSCSDCRGIPRMVSGGLVHSRTIPDETEVFPPEALSLYKSLVQGDSGLRPIAKTVARLVHGYYQFSNYHAVAEEDPDHQPGEDWCHWYDGGGSQLDNAMNFVLLAMAVQVLQNTVSSVGDSPDSYALSTGAIRCTFASRGLLQDILVSGPSQRGLTSLQLLQAAASVWGGFRSSSMSTSTSSDELG